MRLFSIFKRKAEPEAERKALANLDQVTRETTWEEYDKETQREQGGVPLHHVSGDPVPEPVSDPDPADSRSLGDVLHGDNQQE